MPILTRAVVIRASEAFVTAWVACFIPLVFGIIYAPDFKPTRAALIGIGVAAFNAALAALKQVTGFTALGVKRDAGAIE